MPFFRCNDSLNSDYGEDGGTSVASDFDFDVDDEVELEYSVAEPAAKKAKHGRVRQTPAATRQQALAAIGKGKSLPAWHSSHLVSKHPLRSNLETCSACLISYAQEKQHVQRDAYLTAEEKERRFEELDRMGKMASSAFDLSCANNEICSVEESYWNSKRVYARNRHLQQCTLQTYDTQQKAASRYNSHLERHRVYSKNWAERTKPLPSSRLLLNDGEDSDSSVTDG